MSATKSKKAQEIPKPVAHDSRTCFGIDFFKTEDDAVVYANMVAKRGDKYNGGFFHGMPCGRAPEFDYKDDDHGKLYAVTVQ